MLMERITAKPFGEDEDANRAVYAIGTRVRMYADLSKRAAIGNFADERGRAAVTSDAMRLMSIIESRIRSFAIFDDQIAAVIEAARVRQGVTFHPLPDFTPPPHDPALCRLGDEVKAIQARMAELGRRRDKAKRQAINLEAEIAAAGRQLVDANAAIARRKAELGR